LGLGLSHVQYTHFEVFPAQQDYSSEEVLSVFIRKFHYYSPL